MSGLAPLEFLQHVLPPPHEEREYYAIDITPKNKGEKHKSRIKHYSSPSIEEILNKAIEIDSRKSNAYFALASFDATNEEYKKLIEESNGQKGRQANFARDIKCLFLDIDVGKEKNSYADAATAVSELRRVCGLIKIPYPTLNSSGNGLHAYWVFDKPVDIDTWVGLANDFKSLMEEHGLIIDPQVVTDAARILRVLGTNNYNNGIEKPVMCWRMGEIKSFEFYRGIIPKTNKSLLRLQRPKNAPIIDGATKNILENTSSKFSEIHAKSVKGEGCNQIKLAYENQAETSYDIWRAILSTVKVCVDKYEWVQKMSDKHPEFNLDTAINKMEDTGGPQSCETFEKFNPEGCKDCPVKSTVKRPLQLSSFVKAAEDKEIEVESNSAFSKNKATFTIPRIPHPYYRGENGGIYIRESVTDKEGETKEEDTLIYHNDLYLYKRLFDMDLGFVNLAKVHLPQDGVIEFEIPFSAFSSPQELKKVVSRNGVVASNNQMGKIMTYLVKWSNFLEATTKAQQTYKQMGFDKESKLFVLGERLFSAGGISKTPISSRLLTHNHRFNHRGKLEKWKEATQELYARDGEELRQFCLGLGLAAPLYRYEPIAGSMVSMFSKDSGHNKSGTMWSIASMWGNPEHLLMAGKDTPASIMNMLGVHQSIPLCVDELTNIPPDKLSVLTYAVSEGQEPNRLMGSENRQRTNDTRWKLPVFASTNKSFDEKLQQYKPAVEGESARLLEIPFTKNGLSELDNKRLLTAHGQHYGVVAEKFVVWLLGHQDECQRMMRTYENKMREDVTFTTRERFWVTMGYMSLTGIHIGNELDIWDFNIESVYKWLMDFLIRKMNQPKMLSSNPSGVIGSFINRHAKQMLIINSKADLRQDKDERPAPIREPSSAKDALVIRYEPDTKFVYIDSELLGKWVAQHTAFDMGELVELLKQKNICLGKKHKGLGKGWIPTSGQGSTLLFDAEKLEVEDLDEKDSTS